MTEEKTFSVGVQTSSPKRISVTSNVSENPITASADTGLYYSQLAKNWAIGEGLIQNEDYSSKTWAGESKSSADLSKMYSEAASLDLNNLENKIIEYDEQLNTTITEGVETIETLQANSIAEITTNKESALSDITTAETNVLANIDTSKLNTLAQIEELANSSIKDINATGLDSKVSKSGDTMTGDLLLKTSNTLDYTDINHTTNAETAGTIAFTDKNTKMVGQVRSYFNEYNNMVLSLLSRRDINGTEKTAQIQIYVDKDGNANTTAVTPAYSDNSTKIATTQFVKSVLSSSGNGLATFKKATNGYIKFSNGIIVQWGKTATRTSNGVQSVTFPIAFTTTNIAIANSNVVNATAQESGAITTYSKTGFSITAWDDRASMWVAIGY